MRTESIVWDVHGGLPDFEDYEIAQGAAVDFAADTLERVSPDE